MISNPRRWFLARHLWTWVVVAAVLLGAAFLGFRASLRWLVLLGAAIGTIVLLGWPILGLLALIPAALIVPLEFGTGTAVMLNPATSLLPAVLVLWLLDMMRRRELHILSSPVNRPLSLFLLSGLLSLLIGNALWDPAVPRGGNLTSAQLAQWTIFAFSAGAFWLTGNLVQDMTWLRRLAFLFLRIAGGLAVLRVMPSTGAWVHRAATHASVAAPFWMLLAALSGGQLIFNHYLSRAWRLFLLVTLGAVLIYAFHQERDTASHWIGVASVLGILTWLRWPRLRWPIVVLLFGLAATGILSSAVYEFAGGETEWVESGGSRLALIGRVIEVTMRNPITGLGPAAYRIYAAMDPLVYRGAVWVWPLVSSHNNYVDLFSHVGLLGLGLFTWFAVEITMLGFRLRARYAEGFAAGYINGMIAAGAGALVLMLFADWILPFVYNIGFLGFQASVLVWLFLGGLVALEHIDASQDPRATEQERGT